MPCSEAYRAARVKMPATPKPSAKSKAATKVGATGQLQPRMLRFPSRKIIRTGSFCLISVLQMLEKTKSRATTRDKARRRPFEQRPGKWSICSQSYAAGFREGESANNSKARNTIYHVWMLLQIRKAEWEKFQPLVVV